METTKINGSASKNLTFDKNALFERLYKDNESFELITSVMTEFLNKEFPKEFERAVNENDQTAYKFIVHKLKGSASTCCMVNLFNISVELEKLDSIHSEEFVNLKSKLMTEIEECVKLLQE